MKVNLIACVNNQNIIGVENDLYAKCAADMSRFKSLTIDHGANIVIMGYNTWLSLPKSSRPLKDRLNIVLFLERNH